MVSLAHTNVAACLKKLTRRAELSTRRQMDQASIVEAVQPSPAGTHMRLDNFAYLTSVLRCLRQGCSGCLPNIYGSYFLVNVGSRDLQNSFGEVA